MKYKILLVSSALFISNSVFADSDGKKLLTRLCTSCHVTEGKPTIAPPISGVINHVKSAYPARDEFIQRIVDWVGNPEKERALMPGAVKKFGLMPKLSYKPEEVKLIAEFLYDGKMYLPEWYRMHYKKEHGHEPRNKRGR